MLDEKAKTFMKVARCGSFAKAASELYISSVAIMKQVNAFEAQVGAKLLERTNRGVAPTAAGASLLEDLASISAQIDAAISKAVEVQSSGKRTVRIGTSLLRPCRPLIDLWATIGANLPFRLEIVPFEDDARSFANVVARLGEGVDCFVGAHASGGSMAGCGFLPFDEYACRIGVPRSHVLSLKTSLAWDDLDGQTLMLIRPGISVTVDRIRSEIARSHPAITVIDAPGVYDVSLFNECDRKGYLLEVPEMWERVHPSIVVLPMEWEYKLQFGVVYAGQPSETVEAFINALAGAVASVRVGAEGDPK